jgi:hypothetical protein
VGYTKASSFKETMSGNLSSTLPGTVSRVIQSPILNEPEKAQIAVEEGDHLFREIRIDNILKNEKGDEVSLKIGARVEVTVALK